MILVDFLNTLLVTEVVEIIVAYLMGYRGKYFFTTLIFINILTNPLLNYILIVLTYLNILESNSFAIIILEIIVVVVEFGILVYAMQERKKSLLLLTLAINTSSYLVGLLIFR